MIRGLSVFGIVLSFAACTSEVRVGAEIAGVSRNVPAQSPDARGFARVIDVERSLTATRSLADQELVRLELNGSGLCEYGIFAIDVYYAALYLERPTSDAEQATRSGGIACIDKRFCRTVTKKQLCSAWKEAIRLNTGTAFPRYERGLRQLCDLMETVREGEHLTFVVRPRDSVEVRLRGRRVGVVDDAALASIFVGLYLGEYPPDENLRAAMLAGFEPPASTR
ncbi:MAG: chalcone isomerase family protein [Planctomycetes bacterium]|nr:chalcone isomerase family protein [Planctomycetota bacterium]MCB9891882.1 chalcone isomerase family protein [Planctomycetota bacterium]MCB9919857.1 chalcone isomerase family protein [Planctomycetota bacterium]